MRLGKGLGKVKAGVGSQCSKSALRNAKSNVDDDTFFIILSEVRSGLETLFFIANGKLFPELTLLAGENCSPTSGFVQEYGPGVNLAPLEDKARYGTGFPE